MENPANTVVRRRREKILEVRRCVELLATLDFVNGQPAYQEFKKSLKPYQAQIRLASDVRAELRREADANRRPWLVGPEEYDAIERCMIARLGPVMSQSEFQSLLNVYDEEKRKESIKRWNAIPIRILQGGLPS